MSFIIDPHLPYIDYVIKIFCMTEKLRGILKGKMLGKM